MSRASGNPAKIGRTWRWLSIVALTLVTAIIHFTQYTGAPMTELFLLNGLGYLALLAALVLPLEPLIRARRALLAALIGYAALTILAWMGMADKALVIGWVDKAIEVVLIALLALEMARA